LATQIAMRAFTEDRPRKLDTAPSSLPSLAELDERTVEIVQSHIEAALEVERQQNIKFAQATNELATCVLDTLDKMKRDIAHLQKLLDGLSEVKMPSVNALIDTALDRWQQRQRQRLQSH
jgi:hypothetical protein